VAGQSTFFVQWADNYTGTTTDQAPVPGGDDPTAWLPDEVLEYVLRIIPPYDLEKIHQMGPVCQRWHRVISTCQSFKARRWLGRWAIDRGDLSPLELAMPEGTTAEDLSSTVAVGPDGSMYAGGSQGQVWSWAARTGAPLEPLQFGAHSPASLVSVLTIAADGTIYVASDDLVRVWSNGAHVHTLAGHAGAIVAVACGPGDNVYTAGGDAEIRVWSVMDGTAIRQLKWLTTKPTFIVRVVQLAVSHDGDSVYGASIEPSDDESDLYIRQIIRWSAATGNFMMSICVPSGWDLTSLAVGPKGEVFGGGTDGLLHVCIDNRREWRKVFNACGGLNQLMDEEPVCDVAVSSDGTLASVNSSGDLVVITPDESISDAESPHFWCSHPIIPCYDDDDDDVRPSPRTVAVGGGSTVLVYTDHEDFGPALYMW
jgi:hypothetical protein